MSIDISKLTKEQLELLSEYPYRTDKFQRGDKVIWDEKRKTKEYLSRMGEGPFTILKVFNPPEHNPRHFDKKLSEWEGMGHTQHVVLKEYSLTHHGQDNKFSGAFFRKVTT